MSRYETWQTGNLVPKLRQIQNELGLSLSTEGKVQIPLSSDLNQPWVVAKTCMDRNRCHLWLSFYFKYFALIPKACRGCWKSYYRPTSLKELFQLQKFQASKENILPSKCGIELRPFTENLGGYGAFWYNPLGCGLERARANTKKLRALTGKKIELKRGCTEMEQWSVEALGYGSSKWDQLETEYSLWFEQLLGTVFEPTGVIPEKTLPVLKADIFTRWIYHAAVHGDQTYLEFKEEPFFPQLEQYMGSSHDNADFPKQVGENELWSPS